MKNVLFACVCVFMLCSCKQKAEAQAEEIVYKFFGKEIISAVAADVSLMASKYETMKIGDTKNIKIREKIKSACQVKGCWMRLDLEKGNEVMMKFKDKGFFITKYKAGENVIVNGNVFVEEVSVDEQRHYAKDAGKTAEEIASVTQPKKTLSFEADGVLIK